MLVNRYEYPSLDLLMWDMHTDVIDGALALKIYETKWRYLNPHEVSGEEMALIQTEPTRVFRRQFILSHATLADSSNRR